MTAYEDIEFAFTPSQWVFNPLNKRWEYARGKIEVMAAQIEEAGAVFTDAVFTADTVTAFRTQLTRPVPLPGRIEPKPAAPVATTTPFCFPVQLPDNDTPGGLTVNTAVGPAELWIVDEKTDKVFRYSQQGALLGTLALTSSNRDAKDITTDGASFWVLDKKDEKVYRYLMDGTFQDSFALTTPRDHLEGITTDGTSLWVLDKDGGVFRYNLSGTFQNDAFELDSSNSHAEGITTDGTSPLGRG